MSTKNNKRSRNWAFILYPESAPKNWQEKLIELNVQFALSPLHNLDVNPDNGEIKKEHYHVILVFDSVKSYEQVKEITQKLKQPVPQICHSILGSIRYFTHQDNPEKFQYQVENIKVFNGFDIDKYTEMTVTQKKAIIKEICQYIVSADVVEYADLVEYAILENQEWFDTIQSSHTMFLTSFIRSRKFRAKIVNEKE